MSGGAIWIVEYLEGEVWSPDRACLIGIDQSWSESRKWARGTQIQHWLRLVAANYPDLRSMVDRHLAATSP